MNAHHANQPAADPETSPGLSILVRRPGEDAVQLHTGLANLEHAVPIGPDTAFNVGSVAKQITAHLVLLAAQDGLLALDQPASTLLPRLQVHDVTIAELITHRSGLRDAETLLSLAGFRDLDHYTADDLINLAYRQQQRAVPAGQFLYSNTNYLLLAKILEAVHDANLANLACTRLFDQLGMTATHFKTDPRQLIPNAASAYQPTPGGWQHTAQPATLPGPGALWTTPADLDRWLDHLHDRWHRTGAELPDDDTVPYRAADQAYYLYGAGLYADTRTKHCAVFHYGHEQGFSAAVHVAASGARVVCLSNNHVMAADHITETLWAELRKHPNGRVADALARAAAHSTADLRNANHGSEDGVQVRTNRDTDLGTFACSEVPGTLRLTRRHSALFLWRRGSGDRLIGTGPLTYVGPGYRTTLQSADGDYARPDGFILDLDRAPSLYYVKQ